jgi:hypothetical protein
MQLAPAVGQIAAPDLRDPVLVSWETVLLALAVVVGLRVAMRIMMMGWYGKPRRIGRESRRVMNLGRGGMLATQASLMK